MGAKLTSKMRRRHSGLPLKSLYEDGYATSKDNVTFPGEAAPDSRRSATTGVDDCNSPLLSVVRLGAHFESGSLRAKNHLEGGGMHANGGRRLGH